MLSFKEFSEFCVRNSDFIADKLSAQSDELECFYKEDGTEVTQLDLFIEDKLRNAIADTFPEDGILGEEREPHRSTSINKWIIDPIDGTFGFSKGVPLFGTLIGYMEYDQPKYGFLRMPMISDTWVSGNGSEALLCGKQLHTSSHSSWRKSLILTTDQQTIVKSSIKNFWQSALNLGATARTWGDCFGYYMLCTGKAELMADTGLKPCDIFPLIPILLGAGIEVHQIGCTDYSNIIACKKGIFEQIG